MKTLCETYSGKVEAPHLEPEQSAPLNRKGQIYKRILVGTDFSDASVSAFEQGLKLAKQNGAELLIAHCSVVPDGLGFMPEASYCEWQDHCRTEEERDIAVLIEKAIANGVKAHRLFLQGQPETSIIEASRKLSVDLIVIGTHGRRGVSRLMMGSVAGYLVSHAPCAVLTTR